MTTSTAVGFSTPRRFNPVSWLVRKVTGSRSSHAWLAYQDEDFACPMVMEAHEMGFRLVPYSVFLKHNVVVAMFVPKKCDMNLGLRWAAQYLGTHYDYGGLLGMVWVLLGRVLRKKWKNPFQSSKAMFCSEVVTGVLRESGFPGAERLDSTRTSPQDLEDFLRAAKLKPLTVPIWN